MITVNALESVRTKYRVLEPEMDERSRRLWAACEAHSLGHGGITAVSQATGLAIETIRSGLRELKGPRRPAEKECEVSAPEVRRRIRQPGGGRKPLTQKDPEVMEALETLVDPSTRGNPMSPLRWTCKSTRVLAGELRKQGHPVSDRTVARLLKDLNYSLQSNRKTREGQSHPDRNAQFEQINATVKAFQAQGQPVVSVDAKKKERLGDFKNEGQEWRPQGQPEKVRTYDFEDKRLGKAIPYGVYDVTANAGWVSVGVDHDTAEFAVQTIRQWWDQMGKSAYPTAQEILITADSGGSNGARVRMWKVGLQKLADETGLSISVCHLPPGTSKWNKIEHRMFCHITRNWRGRPLESLEVIVSLIGCTTTTKGLRIAAGLDTRSYPKGVKVGKAEMAAVQIDRKDFHGEWNYTIRPRQETTLGKVVTS